MGLFGNPSEPLQLEILPPYAPVRGRTAAVRATWVVGGVIGICSTLHLLAQLQLAAENGHFYDSDSLVIVRILNNQLCRLSCISK